jgi:hypothetical protein
VDTGVILCPLPPGNVTSEDISLVCVSVYIRETGGGMLLLSVYVPEREREERGCKGMCMCVRKRELCVSERER